jgi:hypothetical protein
MQPHFWGPKCFKKKKKKKSLGGVFARARLFWGPTSKQRNCSSRLGKCEEEEEEEEDEGGGGGGGRRRP